VVRTDIVSRQQLNGTLTYAGTYTLINQASPGVYTGLPSPGAVVTRGQILYNIDNRPIPLLYGATEWRALSVGVPDGPDVKQLEQNLLALGFANSSNLIANGHFDSFDAAAVRRWQASLGLTQTGVVAMGDAIFEPGPIRIASVQPTTGMGAQPGQPVIQATSTQRVVTLPLEVSRQGLVKDGDPVVVSLPDSSTVQGTVASVGTVATASQAPGGGSGPATIQVTISLANPAAGGNLDQAPVIVSVTDKVDQGVLAVPVTALLAQPGGTYAVEVVEGHQRRAVTVTTGLFDDRGLVEVTSPDLREGMLVEVPQT
jgi:peptidoglycan hydrolase-like protein with peptidoglycan-binding domain